MKKYPINIHFPIHWGDMDALGHVNHVRYITWFETARCELFRKIGLGSVGQPEVGPILVNVQANYKAPVVFPADLIVSCRVSRFGNTSFVLEYMIAHAHEPEKVVADGSSVVVLINYKTGQKISVPDWLKQAVEKL